MNSSMADPYPASPGSPDRPLPPVSRSHAVSEVTPAKKITFYKSGDPQFSGVRMAINRRSFKSFSALMDDLSNRVPLPFGVRTITTPRGTHTINRLDQLQDGGSYVCSDKKYVQPIAGRKAAAHKTSRPVSARRLAPQDEPEEEFSATHFQQVPKSRKKVVLVKNGDPTVRRSILLNRRNARNFKTFLEDASDLLQFTVRRLYTVDGRRIENIQSVLQSSSVLICAGREPFKPVQPENLRKSISEKLPGLRSHHSSNLNAEILDNKRNANFGLKAKKSVIHPRSPSSNKTRFSLSSEKSDPNGLNTSPANSGFAPPSAHQRPEDTGHSLVNDDIEKKVHVNKDGSLSVEMKVRFRLLNEETLQWSTQIKKSGKARSEQLCLYGEDGHKEMNAEIFSETDESFYPGDADSYCSKPNDAELDVFCAHCGMQCQDYDIWKNPMHAEPQEDHVRRATWKTHSSASSTSSHRQFVSDQKASADSLRTASSEEYTAECVVRQSACYSETKENGETTVRYSRVSRCTSRSGRSTAASNADASSNASGRKSGDSRQSSCSGRKSETIHSQESQHSEGHCEGGSPGDCSGASPPPCPDGERCSPRVNVASQSSHSRRLFKGGGANSKSFGSRVSYDENEERDETCAEATPVNMQRASTEEVESEERGGSKRTKQPAPANGMEGEEDGEQSATDVLSRSSNDCGDECPSRGSSQSTSSARRRRKINKSIQNGGQGSCSSLALSSISKQNSENISERLESLENLEADVTDNKSTSSLSNRRSYSDSRGQSFRSNRSHRTASPVEEAADEQTDRPAPKGEDSCDEPLRSPCLGLPDGDGESSLPVSRPSSKTQSFSSQYNNVSCPENGKNGSGSSGASEKRNGKRLGSSEICSSSKGSTRAASQNSQAEEKADGLNVEAETSSRTSAPETPLIHSPSPPKDKPLSRHLRSAHYKYSSNSMNGDPGKTTNGDGIDGSLCSTPPSKGLLVSKTSIETCKLLKNAAAGNDSAEDLRNTRNRKNSSSSSKRRLKAELSDADNNGSSELTPSALPNVSPEEVVNEWLKNIPSETMVVEYEVEEFQKKVVADVVTKPGDGEQDEVEATETSATEEENNDRDDKDMTDGRCTDNASKTADVNLSEKEENDESFLSNTSKTNNVKEEAGTEDKKSLPNNIQTSVQIMKALLTPLQETKLDRSNSLPEVSQTMGRKLSNSAQVLISCLASLQLLNDGPTDPTKNSSDSKYVELFNIFQALWAEGPTSKSIADLKSAKHYSREDELTPVSSSGVDINSGFDGSGDGSITGGGDGTAGDKSAAKVAELDGKNMQECDEKPASSGDQDAGSGQTATTETVDAGFEEAKSYVMDENMNEKKIDNSSDGDMKGSVKGHGSSDTDVAEEQADINGGTTDIHSTNEAPAQEANSQEANEVNSSSDCQTTIISTSESNGKDNSTADRQTLDADPAWVLKLLKKIEKQFMTHYVDAMNEFKVRWNLENNENLDEMITELKNEVSQRIQRSISTELKKMKSGAGFRVPRPPLGPSRKSSLQADERRRRLQTMHRRSMRGYAGVENVEGGTNDSCETDEEDLTFSASFADDSSGPGNDEFCPCEKCIKEKRALRLTKPRPPAADAPIVRAFDLRQILKNKKENVEPTNAGPEACGNEEEAASGNDCPDTPIEEGTEDSASRAGDDVMATKSDNGGQDGVENEADGQEDKSAVEGDEICEENELQCEATNEEEMENSKVDDKPPKDLDDEEENETTEELNEGLEGAQEREMSVDSQGDEDNTAGCGDGQHNQLEDDHQAEDSEHEETKETSDPGDGNPPEDDVTIKGEVSQNGVCQEENEPANPVIKTEENSEDDETEAVQSHGFYFQRSCLGQGSLITQNGSAEDPEGCKDTNNTLGETPLNGQSNSSGSKQSQMYPDSSSEEEEAGDSPQESPVKVSKNGSTGRAGKNIKGSFEDCDGSSKKDLEDDIIDQEDLDF